MREGLRKAGGWEKDDSVETRRRVTGWRDAVEWLISGFRASDQRQCFQRRQRKLRRPYREAPSVLTEGNAFVIVNGVERFNRPLYGGNTAFRVDGGDKPEFSLYLPGRGGNLRFAVRSGGTTWWLHDAQRIETRYLPGELEYRVRDPRLGEGDIRLRVLADFATEAVLVRSEGKAIARGTSLAWALGGVNGQRGARDGDIGTERVAISQYFQPQPEFADGNRIEVAKNSFDLHSDSGNLHGAVLGGSVVGLASADHWDDLSRLFVVSEAPSSRPLAIGTLELAPKPSVMVIQAMTRGPNAQSLATRSDDKDREAGRSRHLCACLPAGDARSMRGREGSKSTTEQLLVSTSHPFLNASVAALNAAGDAIRDDTEKGVMHGAIAWRVKLLGWRSSCAPDALGQHERAAINFRGWLGKQNVAADTGRDSGTG